MNETDCSHPAWTHIGMERYCAICGIDRDDLPESGRCNERKP